MTNYTITAETSSGDLGRQHVEDIIEGLAGHGPVVAMNDAGHTELLLSVDAPSLAAATRIALLLLGDEAAAVPTLRSLVVEPSEDFDRRVAQAVDDVIAETISGAGATLEEAQQMHPSFRKLSLAPVPAPED